LPDQCRPIADNRVVVAGNLSRRCVAHHADLVGAKAARGPQRRRQRACPHCGAHQLSKGQHTLVLRTLFGKLTSPSPRFVTCPCQAAEQQSFSPLADLLPERTTPELRYLQTKWAALVPYGVTVDLLEDVLPIHVGRTSVVRQVQRVAERLEGALGDEQAFFIDGCQRDWDRLPIPDGPITVGIDGGYVHARKGENRKAGWFEVIVGKSMPTEGAAKCFGLVTNYDTKPRRRLFETLKGQGLQMNQSVTFLSDGGENVRDLQLYLSPQAEHLLDWFHVTMRLTVLQQLRKELAQAHRRSRSMRSRSIWTASSGACGTATSSARSSSSTTCMMSWTQRARRCLQQPN
jgi:hypothetical protein